MTAGRRAHASVVVLLIGLALVAFEAPAQGKPRETAVPMYDAQAYARGEAIFVDARSRPWAAESAQLTAAVTAYCDGGPLNAARAHWIATAAAWDALAALSTGPLIERRSARSIDFSPVRRELLEREIASEPASVEELESVGAPARGLGALEWLLWRELAAPRSPACAYARLVAADIEREAVAVALSARESLAARPDDREAAARLAETVNQWVAGIEQLRWTFMRKPLDVAAARHAQPVFPRSFSGQTAATWRYRWATLRAAAVLGDRPVPAPGEASVPFETLLRGRGLDTLADRLVATTTRVDRAFLKLSPQRANSVRTAATALGGLTRFAQDELAPALAVQIGFSDADGD